MTSQAQFMRNAPLPTKTCRFKGKVLLTLFVVIGLLISTQAIAATATYAYDQLNRLTSATIDGSRIEYTYDSAGNIAQVLTPYVISATTSGTGTGTVSDDFAKLDCGADCDGVYDLNTIVTLAANPNTGSAFNGWSGACTGVGTCEITVSGRTSVDAAFVIASADLAITKTDGQGSVTPGATTTYTIVVSNNGPTAVADASVADTFPASLLCNYTSIAAGGATGNTLSSAGNISDTLTLPVGALVTYTAPCDIASDATGTLSNSAMVNSTVSDSTPGNNSATDNSTLVPSADLAITKTDNLETAIPGSSTSYTIVARNNGPSDVSDATVADSFAASLTCTYTSTVDTGVSGNTASSSGNISETLVMPAGTSATYSATCDIGGGASGTLSNTATISSAVSDPVTGNESATDNTSLDYCNYTVSQPSGGETWTRGKTYSVNWTASGNSCASTVKLELYKAGALHRTISTSTSDTTFSWKIPLSQISGNDFKVKVTGNSPSAFTGESVSNFTIKAPVTCNAKLVTSVVENFDTAYEACEILVIGPDFLAEDGASTSLSSGWEIWLMPETLIQKGATLDAKVCGQSLCMTNPSPMPYGCHSCVTRICDIDPACCDTGFSQACLDKVSTVCGLVCE